MQVLFLEMNSLNRTTPYELTGMISLTEVDLSINQLIGDHPNLEILQVWDNNFLYILPENLGQNGKLEVLDVNGSIPPRFFNLPLVTTIEVSSNNLSGELPSDMSSNVLRILTLSNNSFTVKIPPAIGRLLSLQSLLLDMNQFAGEIPKVIFDLEMLTKMNMSFSNLIGPIPNSVSSCVSLMAVDLIGT